MSITSELRDFVDGLACHKVTRDMLREIADRIDAEHESACAAAYGNGVQSVALPDMTNYIELPKDADGETIHLQDRVSWDNGTFNVHELNLTADGWTTWDEPHGYTVRADQCHHVKPDSWERIISDATALGAQMKRRTYQIGDFVERCKKLAGEDA